MSPMQISLYYFKINGKDFKQRPFYCQYYNNYQKVLAFQTKQMYNYLPCQPYLQFAYPLHPNCYFNPYFYFNSIPQNHNYPTSSTTENAYNQTSEEESALKVEPATVNCQKIQKNIILVRNCLQKTKENTDNNYIQISSRNLLPNIINMIVSYIRRINKSGKMVQRIIQKCHGGSKFSAKKFYSYQAYLKESTSRNNTKHTLAEITMTVDPANYIFSVEEQQFYNMVCRMLIAHFLKGQYMLCLLNSWKIQKTNKKEHLKVRRYLTLKLEQAGNEIMEMYKNLEQ